VERQLEDCLRRADAEGWHVVETYTDNDIGASAKSRKPRPGYARMLSEARRGEFDIILSYSNSRLT
jgi:site-specific DNA recombinase